MIKAITLYLTFILANLPWTYAGINAYLYYEDAVCTDSNTIYGTLSVAYDSSYLSGYGVTQEGYEGDCLYFDGGSLSVYYYASYESYIQTGYCVTCNGVASCSSDNSCDNAVTISSSNLYQMSQYQEEYDDSSSNINNKKKEVWPNPFKAAEELDTVAMQIIQNSQNGNSGASRALYSIVGALIGAVGWFSILAGIKSYTKWRPRKQMKQNIELSESLSSQV